MLCDSCGKECLPASELKVAATASQVDILSSFEVSLLATGQLGTFRMKLRQGDHHKYVCQPLFEDFIEKMWAMKVLWCLLKGCPWIECVNLLPG
eukprot:534822-Pelagomonas_calceolata.AAC.1